MWLLSKTTKEIGYIFYRLSYVLLCNTYRSTSTDHLKPGQKYKAKVLFPFLTVRLYSGTFVHLCSGLNWMKPLVVLRISSTEPGK